MTLQGTATREKLGHNKEVLIQKIYYVKLWSVFTCLRYSYSMSAICTIDIRTNFSSNKMCCTLSSEMASIWPRQLHR